MTSVRIIEKESGTIQFILDETNTKASAEDKNFVQILSQYEAKLLNSTLVIRDPKTQQVATHIHITDNTQLVNDLAVANLFGAKRFLVGKLANSLQLMEEKITDKQTQAIKFSRDISFPLSLETHPWQGEPLTLEEFRRRSGKANIYDTLAEVFNRCADFTPGKQEEYCSGGKIEDKYCRFHPKEQKDDNVIIDHVFTTGVDKSFTGTMSYTITINNTDEVDVYFFDEVADYFKLLSTEDKNTITKHAAALQALNAVKEKDATTKQQIETLENEVNAITNKARATFFNDLFGWAALCVRKTLIEKLHWSEEKLDQAIADNQVRGFIRAASGRVELYRELGCGKGKFHHPVIHGPRTVYGNMLDNFFKERATKQLQALATPQYSSASMLSQQRGYGQINNTGEVQQQTNEPTTETLRLV